MSPSTTPASIDASCPGVADQDQTRLGSHRLDQPRHQRQRHHRGLVDDHHVVREAVGAVVREAAVASRSPAEQPMERRRSRADGLLVDGLLQAGGRFAGGRGQRDQRRPAAVGRGPLDQLRDHPGHPRGLAGAGAAGDHLEPAARGQLVQVGGDRALLVPVAVEVQARAEQSQRPCARQCPRRRGPTHSRRARAATHRPPARAARTDQPARPIRRWLCRGSWRGRRTRGRAGGRAPRAPPPASPRRSPRRPARRAAWRRGRPPPTAARSR